MICHLSLEYLQPVTDLPTWVVALIFFVPFGGGLIFYFYKTRHARTWRKGIYPPNLPFNQDNLLEAYLALGSLLILLDHKKAKGKTQFINTYFNKYFQKSTYSFGDSLLFSINHPINIETVCSWLNKHLDSEGERSQVIYFLTGLALLREDLSERELRFLQVMNDKLRLPKENLNRIIAIYESYYSKQQEEKKSRIRKSNRSQESFFKDILGLKGESTEKEIKKAYRKLVKLHHPDVFATSSDAQRKMAKEKFIEIQEAYDGLMIFFSQKG